EMISALAVTDAAVIVTSAAGQLSVGTERAIDMAAERAVPSLLFVNGVNKENSSFTATIAAIREKYKSVVVAEYPIMDGLKMVGAASVIENKAYDLSGKEIAVPEAIKPLIGESRMEMMELAAETDDELLMKYLEEGELSDDEFAAGLGNAVRSGKAILAFGGSATANMGITRFMDAVIAYLPSPAKRVIKAKTDSGEVTVLCSPDAPVLLQVFKTIVDPFFGKLNIFKVFSGTLKSGTPLLNISKDETEKTGTIYFLKGKSQESGEQVAAGDIGALAKLQSVTTGDTLTAPEAKMELPPIVVPDAVISMAVYAKKQGEEDKIFAGLNRLKDEDISFSVTKNQETNEMLLSGAGEPHLEVLNKKLKNKFGCEAELREPKIAYKETIRSTVEAEGKHKKQSGGAGQFGQCMIRFEPGAADGVFEFVDAVVGGAV
ncbi:MAG TPA: GTP-binding protein, partial [Eubacteriales bacterium]|nr:GTP-binding protein [Eubacteriales bacterium]